MKISLAQLNFNIGNFEGNLSKILKAIELARSEKADIVLFPELSTTGYPPRDFLNFNDFIERNETCIKKIAEASKNIVVVVGSPRRNPVVEGKDLYNSALVICDGVIEHIADKALLPTYDVFDEYRYFEPAKKFKLLKIKGKQVAITICEDIWNVGNENPLYTVCPLDQMLNKRSKADLILNLSASPFSFSHAKERLHVLRANVKRYKCPVFYCNQVGGQTELIFDGGSVVMSPNGNVFDEMPYFEECQRTYDLAEVLKGKQNKELPKIKMQLIHDALLLGIRDYFSKLGLKKAILGLSGGIDSAVVAVLAQRALGAENVRVLLMPSQFSSGHSVADARTLAERLNIQHDIVAIKDIYESFTSVLAPIFTATEENVTEENLQARARGMLLMAVSNKFGNVLLNTSNKSEMAVGYGTLYGDMCGGLAILGDLYKTEVYELAKFINKEREVIPLNSIIKPPSAELRPGQTDQDSLPPYEVLDKILYQYIEEFKGPAEIIAQGFDSALVNRVLRMVNINEFKRYQTPPVLRLSSKAFGSGRRLPIVAKYLG